MDLVDRPLTEEDERKMKNLATRIMNNGVEVLVKDKSTDAKQDQVCVDRIMMTSEYWKVR